jgi:CheY-like chemotaxis protein
LGGRAYDCLVVDFGLLEDAGRGVDALRTRSVSPGLAIIVRVRRTLSREEYLALHTVADAVVQSGVNADETLLACSSRFLHTPSAALSERQQGILRERRAKSAELIGARVLVIDDDIRNIFAMTTALERHGASVVSSEDGRTGLELLQGAEPVDAVMVDVMMPEMDGYEVMRRIRADDRFKKLPVIAVTAKAMAADREKCIAAGATDYMAKPVEIERLVTLLKLRLLH